MDNTYKIKMLEFMLSSFEKDTEMKNDMRVFDYILYDVIKRRINDSKAFTQEDKLLYNEILDRQYEDIREKLSRNLIIYTYNGEAIYNKQIELYLIHKLEEKISIDIILYEVFRRNDRAKRVFKANISNIAAVGSYRLDSNETLKFNEHIIFEIIKRQIIIEHYIDVIHPVSISENGVTFRAYDEIITPLEEEAAKQVLECRFENILFDNDEV